MENTCATCIQQCANKRAYGKGCANHVSQAEMNRYKRKKAKSPPIKSYYVKGKGWVYE